jgi:hypothetical protein
MIEGEDQLVVGVDDVDHDPQVLGELGVVGDDEFICDVDGAAERRLVVVQGHAGRRHRRRGRFLPAARRQRARQDNERSETERDTRTRLTKSHD